MHRADSFSIPAGSRFRRHEHATAHVCAVLDGGFAEREGGGWRDVGPGMVRVSDAARHDLDFGPRGARCLLLEIEEAGLLPPPAPRFIEPDAWLTLLAERLAAAARTADPARPLVLDGLATEFLAQLARRLGGKTSAPPPWLERVRELLHDTTGAAPISELAREAEVHRVHLARSFRDHYGVPVTVYARRLRLAAAQRLIADRDIPLARVAARAGFADQSHLTRAVRAALGTTPAALRRTLPPFKTALRAHS